MIKAVIFDLDNTLVNFMRVKRAAVSGAVEAMIDAGLPVSKDEAIKQVFNMYDREGIEDQRIFDKMLVEKYGQIDYRILAAGVVGYRRAKEGNMVLYPHVRQTVMQLIRMGLKLGLVSDAPRMSAWTRLISLGLDSFFDAVVANEDTGKRKPDPAPFQLALSRLNVKAEDAIMVGDWAERDMVGAKALGMKTAFARYGDDFNTQDAGADFELADIHQLVDIVKRLNERGA
ncbi:MAG: Phosphoglycolate phosphatase [Elusimicrobia bacterium]|nr:Phosphoglycolate phosphatase [Elusimicrobiota bacterium]